MEIMQDRPHIFFDFDDTLSDQQILRIQYLRELSCLLSAKYGLGAEAWSRELVPALKASVHRYVEAHSGRPEPGYARWITEERAQVARELFGAVGVPTPKDESLSQLALVLQTEALLKCNASYPGAAASICQLHNAGFVVCMASSQESDFLRPALSGTGLEPVMLHYFGPDLIDYPKEGPEFYMRVFAKCGVQPHEAIVVDDQAMCLDWAEEVGARVIQACMINGSEPEFPICFTNYDELPAIVEGLCGAGRGIL